MANFGTGDCPDFYPLPRDCDGCGAASARLGGQPRPTHVRAGGFQAVYSLGVYGERPGCQEREGGANLRKS